MLANDEIPFFEDCIKESVEWVFRRRQMPGPCELRATSAPPPESQLPSPDYEFIKFLSG